RSRAARGRCMRMLRAAQLADPATEARFLVICPDGSLHTPAAGEGSAHRDGARLPSRIAVHDDGVVVCRGRLLHLLGDARRYARILSLMTMMRAANVTSSVATIAAVTSHCSCS